MFILNIEWGSVADWVGALGSIGAIFAVIYQVHKQREEFLESNRKDGEVCIEPFEKNGSYILKY